MFSNVTATSDRRYSATANISDTDPESIKKSTKKKKTEDTKIIKIRGEMRYNTEVSEEKRKQEKITEDRYKRNHIGLKIVEAVLVPSARVGNNETNRLKIIRYVHEKKYKVTGINSRGFGRVELVFDNYVDANKCLADTQIGNKEKIVNFYVPRRAMSCKGVVS